MLTYNLISAKKIVNIPDYCRKTVYHTYGI